MHAHEWVVLVGGRVQVLPTPRLDFVGVSKDHPLENYGPPPEARALFLTLSKIFRKFRGSQSLSFSGSPPKL